MDKFGNHSDLVYLGNWEPLGVAFKSVRLLDMQDITLLKTVAIKYLSSYRDHVTVALYHDAPFIHCTTFTVVHSL